MGGTIIWELVNIRRNARKKGNRRIIILFLKYMNSPPHISSIEDTWNIRGLEHEGK
jgi:hypothetical protein